VSFFGGDKKNDFEFDDGKKKDDKNGGRKPPSTARVVLWIAVAALAVYMIGSGLFSVMNGGG
jgi:hypothetical protein